MFTAIKKRIEEIYEKVEKPEITIKVIVFWFQLKDGK